jgi:hypothetical protein
MPLRKGGSADLRRADRATASVTAGRARLAHVADDLDNATASAVLSTIYELGRLGAAKKLINDLQPSDAVGLITRRSRVRIPPPLFGEARIGGAFSFRGRVPMALLGPNWGPIL